MLKIFTPFIILLLVMGSLFLLNERQAFEVNSLTQIDPIPHVKKLIKEKKYVDAEAYLRYFMEYDYVKKNPEASKLMQQIQTTRNSFEYKKRKIIQGIVQGHSDENIGRASAIASDFLVIGDIRDLVIEGMHYSNDEKVDKLMLSLSTLGLLATASTVYSLGASAPIKGSISLLKYGRRLNKIPTWLQKRLIKEVELAQKTKSLKAIEKSLLPIQELYQKVGLNQTLALLSRSRNLKELTHLNKFATRFGTKSQVLLQITNNTALKQIEKMPNVPTKTFLYASTYGERGLKALQRLGATKFMKKVRVGANLAKTTYKGNLLPLLMRLLNKIPNSLLYAISFLGLFYFVWKFFTFAKRVF
jgi:hypothetical protein